MDTEEKKALGRRAREARKARQLTQQQLATKASVSLGVISNLENGHTIPQGANRRTITEALGVDIFGDGLAQAARDSWPEDVQIFTDVLGGFLAALDPAERAAQVARWMTDIVHARDEHPAD